MAAQLDHLAAAMAEPLVTVQVLRLTAPAHVLCAGFTILSFPADGFTDVGSRAQR